MKYILTIILTLFSLQLIANETIIKQENESHWKVQKPIMPHYPVKAAKEAIQGCVNMSFTINSKGRVQDISVISSYPADVFDHSAVHAMERFRYKPTELNKKKIPVRDTKILTFQYQSDTIQPIPVETLNQECSFLKNSDDMSTGKTANI